MPCWEVKTITYVTVLVSKTLVPSFLLSPNQQVSVPVLHPHNIQMQLANHLAAA